MMILKSSVVALLLIACVIAVSTELRFRTEKLHATRDTPDAPTPIDLSSKRHGVIFEFSRFKSHPESHIAVFSVRNSNKNSVWIDGYDKTTPHITFERRIAGKWERYRVLSCGSELAFREVETNEGYEFEIDLINLPRYDEYRSEDFGPFVPIRIGLRVMTLDKDDIEFDMIWNELSNLAGSSGTRESNITKR